jgi:hypothetical protein
MRSAFLSVVAAVAALFIGGCGKQKTPQDAAREFFDLIKAGQVNAAYESATFAFKAQQSPTFFDAALKETGLDAITSATFDAPEMKEEGRTAKVKGTFETKGRGPVVMNVTLTQESGDWRIFALTTPKTAANGGAQNRFSIVGRAPDFVEPVKRQPAPDQQTVRALIRDSMLRFNEAVKQKDFTEFFEKTSLAWQDQLVTGEVSANPGTLRRVLTEKQKEIGAGRLQHAFQPFIDKEVNMDNIADKGPVLDGPPLVSTDGLLLVSGHYETEPYKTFFALKYQYELPKWKLFGIDVTLRK